VSTRQLPISPLINVFSMSQFPTGARCQVSLLGVSVHFWGPELVATFRCNRLGPAVLVMCGTPCMRLANSAAENTALVDTLARSSLVRFQRGLGSPTLACSLSEPAFNSISPCYRFRNRTFLVWPFRRICLGRKRGSLDDWNSCGTPRMLSGCGLPARISLPM